MIRCSVFRAALWMISLFVFFGLDHVAKATGIGTRESPIVIDQLPYTVAGTTGGRLNSIDDYSCSTVGAGGPEVIYEVELSDSARLTAWVGNTNGNLDIYLADRKPGSALTTDCLKVGSRGVRGTSVVEEDLEPGTYYLIVESRDGADSSYSYVLRAFAIGDDWHEFPIAQGVVWKSRRGRVAGGRRQVVNLIEADLSVPGVRVEPAISKGCQSLQAHAASAGPTVVAAVNTSFFSQCVPMTLAMANGDVLAHNTMDEYSHGTIGIIDGTVGFRKIGNQQSWLGADEAQSGLPSLVIDGSALVSSDAWSEEGSFDSHFHEPHPRTFLGHRGGTTIVAGTVDGRRDNADGLSMKDLANWVASEPIAADDAINLDGGGSTTMWIAGMTPNGVVNYPSGPWGARETQEHGEAREVPGAFLIHGEPYNFRPRITSEPGTEVKVGEQYVYDTESHDQNPEQVLRYGIEQAPHGMTIDESTGEVNYVPSKWADTENVVILYAEDDLGLKAMQTFTLSVVGTKPYAEIGSTEIAGCGIGGATHTNTQMIWVLALLLLGGTSRRRRKLLRSSTLAEW